jgi:hypothetical protein
MTKIMTKYQAAIQADKDQAREQLLKNYIKPGQTIYTVQRHVSASGMSRNLSVLVSNGDKVEDITYYVAQALGDKLTYHAGHRVIKVNGCGMDMGFHLIYSLSSVLFHGQDRAGYVLKHAWR